MNESLFQISCPSCESVFAVTDPELIGQIIACPKCGGMMLVEATERGGNAADAETAQDSENASDGEGGEMGEVAQENETFANGEVAQEERVGENSETGEGNAEENASDGEKRGASGERSRGGKLVASGIALALVGGALAFWGTRGFNGGASSAPEKNVATENSKNGENGENSEAGRDGESASDVAKDDVGGFAPFAVEERTGENAENEGAIDFALDDSDDSTVSTAEEGGDAAFGEIGGVGKAGGVGEAIGIGINGENKGSKGNETNGDGGEDAPILSDAPNGTSNDGEVADVSEDGEGAAVASKEENAPNGTSNDAEVGGTGEVGEDGETGGLGGLGDLEGLGEGDALDVEENGEELDESDALEDNDGESANGEKLAGSNDSTGFNEADFERANQNADPENADEPAEVDWSGVAATTNPTLQGALPTLRRERKEIDVDARLALPIKSIEFPSSPVAAIRLLSEFTGVSIVPDLETFVLTRPSTSATLDLAMRDATAGEALEKVAELLNWEVYEEQDRLLLRPSDENFSTPIEERFDVADLTAARGTSEDETRLEMFELPNNLTPDALAALIKSTVAPETWSENEGNANLTVDGTILAVAHNAQNREKTRILLEGLRAIRGLEPQENVAPEQIIPEKLGWEKLTKKTTFAPLTPVALQNALEILEKSQKLQVFWDDAALIEAGVGRDSTTAARLENGTLDAVLSEILEPLNATYLILGKDLILVTSKSVAERYRTVEFFSLIGEKGERPTLAEARTLVEEIKRTIAPETWRASGELASENASSGETGEVAANTSNGDDGEIGENEGIKGNGEVAGNGKETSEIATGIKGEDAALGQAELGLSAAIWLDVESSCLIIRQSQPNQRALRRWLSARLENSKASTEQKGEKTN